MNIRPTIVPWKLSTWTMSLPITYHTIEQAGNRMTHRDSGKSFGIRYLSLLVSWPGLYSMWLRGRWVRYDGRRDWQLLGGKREGASDLGGIGIKGQWAGRDFKNHFPRSALLRIRNAIVYIYELTVGVVIIVWQSTVFLLHRLYQNSQRGRDY